MAIVFLRAFIMYILVIIGVRIMGKRQIAELQPSELVTTILISNITVLAIQETSVPLLYAMVPILSIISFEVILSFFCLKSTGLRKIVVGHPRAVINHGVINQDALKELRMSVDDLMSQLRLQQIFDINDVDCAMVETNGNLSVYQSFKARNVTTQMLDVPSNENTDSPPQFVVISDGKILDQALILCNKNETWIMSTLKSEKKKLKDILLMTCDEQSNYTIIPKEV